MLQLTVADAPTPVQPDAAAHESTARRELVHQRDFRLRQLAELEVTIASASSFSADEPQHQVILDLQLAATIALTEIDAALNRMETGTYGQCERCHTAISRERLAVLPMVRLCMPCQATHDSQMRRKGAEARRD